MSERMQAGYRFTSSGSGRVQPGLGRGTLAWEATGHRVQSSSEPGLPLSSPPASSWRPAAVDAPARSMPIEVSRR